MPAVSKVGDTCKPFISVPIIVTGSPDVFVNGKPVAREGDYTGTFQKRRGRRVVSIDSQLLAHNDDQTVFVNDKPVAQIGTPGTNETVVITGSPNVNIG